MNTAATLTDAQREALRQQLEARKAQLLQELGDVQRETMAVVQAASSGDAEPPGSPRDQANSMAQNMVRDAGASRDHDELVAVRAALARLVDGTYGECIDCGQPVGAARLEVQPAAARCINCQTAAEARG